MVYVLAGSHAQAQVYIKHHALNPRKTTIISSVHNVRGTRRIHVLLCGTYSERKDLDEITDYLNFADASYQHVSI